MHALQWGRFTVGLSAQERFLKNFLNMQGSTQYLQHKKEGWSAQE